MPVLLGRTHVPEEYSRLLLDCSSCEEGCQDWNPEQSDSAILLFHMVSGPSWGEAEGVEERPAGWNAGGEPPRGYSDLRDTDQK